MTNINNTKTLAITAMFFFNLFALSRLGYAQFGGGTGDWWDPYIIATTGHWLELADSVNSGINYHEKEFLLTADLDFAGIDFVPIGGKDVNNNDSYFAGKFDGCNHSILNVQVGVSWYAGLFGNIWDATVKNLTLGGNSRIEGLYYVGGIVGRASYGIINNCHVEKTVTIAASQNSSACFGGIAGGIENRTVLLRCTNVGTVTSNGNYYVRYVGGIAGYVANDLPAIRYCINYGAVDGHRYVGGVVGNYEKDYELKGCLTGAYCTLFAVGQSDSSQGINLPGQANSMHTITFGENVHYYISPWARVNHFEGKDYYDAGSQIAFNLYPDSGAPDGYLPLFDVNGVQHRPGDSIKITMPAEDVTITVSGTLRDIAYGPWVSVSLSQESFEYNGSVQVPAVTVTDTQNETPVTLTEGTDYEVILPSNSIYPGTYTIVINGLGDFGGTVETQYSITSPFGNWIGEGTEESPYLIFTTDDMHRLAQRVSIDPYPTYLCEGEFFSLQNDLDYSGKDYSPIGIGYSSRCFNGTFNGNGHALINVVIQGNGDYQALFGHIGKSGVVSGLTLGEGSSIEGRSYVGGIVAWCEDGTVSDCSTAEGVTIRANTSDCAGGIVSRFTGGDPFDSIPSTGRIANCLNRANVSSNGVYCGGIVGQQSDDGIIVTRCVNEGNVSGSRLVGGIVGDFCKGEVEHCLNLGAVSASGNSYVGGIAGKSDGRVYNNYYAGACSVGGLGAENSATGADATNAQRGYAASGENGITLGLENTVRGLAHNGLIYAETNRPIRISITPPEGYAPLNGYTVSAGSLTSHKSYWELRMPAEDVTISAILGLPLTVAGYGASSDAGWRLIASPVEGSISATEVGNLIPNNPNSIYYDLYRFNQGMKLEWENWKQSGGHYHFDLENGRGYLYATKGDQTLVFAGTYNQGTDPVEVPLTYTDANPSTAMRGWNLVGNPFTAAATIGVRDFYRMNPEGTEIIVATDPSIAAMEGIFVHTDTDGEMLTFTKATRGTENHERIVINLSGVSASSTPTIIDRAIVRTGECRTLPKFQISDNSTKLSFLQDGKDYAVVTIGRNAARHVSTGEIPLNFKPAKNGTYTLSFDIENIELDYLHLIDNMTGADVDLVATSTDSMATYTFAAKTTDYASRFRLVFSTNPNCGDAIGDNASFAYIDASGNIVITAEAGTASLQLIDVMGRVVHCGDPRHSVSTARIPAGVYVLRLIGGEKVLTQKIVIH